MYKYGMRLRPFSIGCQPTDGLIRVEDDNTGKYWNILYYAFPLNDHEQEGFELDYLGEQLEQEPCEDAISRNAMLDYQQYLHGKMSNEENHKLWEFIKDLPSVTLTRKKDGWIPCSERLPEENGRYIVTRGLNACGSLWNRVYIVNYSDLMGIKKEKIWWDGNVGKSDFERYDDVLAWMPLPEKYKGENEE